MSTEASLYIGPYAMWVDAAAPEDPETGDVLVGRGLGYHWGPDGRAEIRFGKGPVRAIFFTPAGRRRGGPQRVMAYADAPRGGMAGLDLRDIDQVAELEAFREAYAKELAQLAEQLGTEPTFCWGVLYQYG